MEKLYDKASVELGLSGWTEELSVVCDGYMRAMWKKKGDVADWVFYIETEEEEEKKDTVVCVLILRMQTDFKAKMNVHPDVLMYTSVDVMIESLKKAIIRLMNKKMGGGILCQII